jgi:uncharacterized membrane protein YheB (UPF0754 family)
MLPRAHTQTNLRLERFAGGKAGMNYTNEQQTMSNQIDPLSGYDFCYKAMSDESRDQLSKDLQSAVEQSCKSVDDFLKQEVAKAVERMYSEIIARPLSQIIREETSAYELFSSVSDFVVDKLEKTDPAKIGNKYCVDRLIKAWFEKFPGSAKQLCDAVLLEENKKLKENLEFQVRVANRSY